MLSLVGESPCREVMPLLLRYDAARKRRTRKRWGLESDGPKRSVGRKHRAACLLCSLSGQIRASAAAFSCSSSLFNSGALARMNAWINAVCGFSTHETRDAPRLVVMRSEEHTSELQSR